MSRAVIRLVLLVMCCRSRSLDKASARLVAIPRKDEPASFLVDRIPVPIIEPARDVVECPNAQPNLRHAALAGEAARRLEETLANASAATPRAHAHLVDVEHRHSVLPGG